MSASRGRGLLLPVLVLGCGLAFAEEAEAPEMAFIEYLGMWGASDEEWTMFAVEGGRATAEIEAKRTDPAPEGEESKEMDDED